MDRGISRGLDIAGWTLDNEGKVVESQSKLYVAWRAGTGVCVALHEGATTPSERLLQAIWWHQRVRREELRLADGRTLRVLHPGFWNREAGPDFRRAVLQFDDGPVVEGDVEVDLERQGWQGHRHHVNPAYGRVALHVVWADSRACADPSGLPVLALEHVLDAPLSELAIWLTSETEREFPEAYLGQCCAPLRGRSAEQVREMLRQAAAARFRAKASWFAARARQAGWEQALWEGLFRALGYKRNTWPMQRLGELRLRVGPVGEGQGEALAWQAALLGVAGLLPSEVRPRSAAGSEYVRQLWDLWWRQRETLADCLLPRSLWCFSGMRPSNRPERRLALAAHWLAEGKLSAALERWCAGAPSSGRKGRKGREGSEWVRSLAEVMAVGRDRYWSWHWTFRSSRLRRPQPLLGPARLTDLAVNVVLPWLWVRAGEGRNERLRQEMERRYFAWSPSEDNVVLRLARRRLLGTESGSLLDTASAQQGLLQIVQDFCEQSNAVCGGCRFPELVERWSGPTEGPG